MNYILNIKSVGHISLSPQVLTFLSNLLVVTNSSVNILIYAFKVQYMDIEISIGGYMFTLLVRHFRIPQDFKFRQILGYIFCGHPLRPVRGGQTEQSQARSGRRILSNTYYPLLLLLHHQAHPNSFDLNTYI